jgi:hypothetical protein
MVVTSPGLPQLLAYSADAHITMQLGSGDDEDAKPAKLEFLLSVLKK